jgi:hypothetical protein
MFSSAVFAMVTIVQVRYWCGPNVTIAKEQRVGGQVKLRRSSDPKGGVGPDCFACVFVYLGSSLFVDCTNYLFRTKSESLCN